MAPPLRISAVILSYNRPDFLRRVLLAHAAQTRLVDEVVITDDGSRVDVPAGIADVLPELPFPVIFVRQPDLGFRAAKCRNNGIREATGDYLVFADQDIVFVPSYVETFVTHARPREFLVGYPVRLDDATTAQLTDDAIRRGSLGGLVDEAGTRKVRRQYRKELFYRILHAVRLRRIASKLRSGVFGAWRSDLLAVNGFDEEYQGWGNEDDDLGRRLHHSGILGRNVFRKAASIHMYHAPHHAPGEVSNQAYHTRREHAVRRGAVRAPHGVHNPLGGDESSRIVLHDPRG